MDTQTPQKETVEVLSVFGEKEKSWSIDKYQLTVGLSIVSVIAIMGGIVWLASGGGANASSSSASPYPTGELDFTQNKASGQTDIRSLPYPQVKQAQPLLPGKSGAKTVAKTPTPTEEADKPAATPSPTPTSAPSNSNNSTPTATPTPTPTADTTATPEPTATPSPTP